MKRISDLRLEQIELELASMDREILRTLKQLKFVKTNQVQRVFYPPLCCSPRAALTAATRKLNWLMAKGLISHLEKRIGGVRAGSQGLIWHLTEAGGRLLMLGNEEEKKRKRVLEPSRTFLRHSLAISECYVQVVTICRDERGMELLQILLEPECWRTYETGGKTVSLRPDLYAETVSGEYRDFWFIEMDLDTESAGSIVEKCRRYLQYYGTQNEQKVNDVFPIVLWIVPTAERKENLCRSIKESFGNRYVHIFLVITPDELHKVMRDGAEKERLC